MTTLTRKFSQFVGQNVAEGVGLTGGANSIGPNSGGGGATTAVIIQVAGGPVLIPGKWVRINVNGLDVPIGAYVPALATNAHLGEVIGVVINALPNNQYTVQQAGYIADTTSLVAFPTLIVGNPYFLDTATPGNMVNVDASISGQDSRPVFIPDTTTSGWVVPYRGIIINGEPINGGDGMSPSIHQITQPGNTFQVGDWLYISADNTYSKSVNSSLATAQTVGVVITAGDPTFTLQFSGWNSNTVIGAVDTTGGALAIVAGTTYYISQVPGKITPTVLPGAISKPVFVSESATNVSGWVLPQRPLSQSSGNPNASPPVFLGTLNHDNGYANPNIFQDNLGNFFNSYFIIFNNGPNNGTNLGCRATSTSSLGVGFQWYIGGAYLNTLGVYASYMSGVNNSGGNNTATFWGFVANDLSVPGRDNAVILPRINTDVRINSFSAIVSIGRSPSGDGVTMNFNGFVVSETLPVDLANTTTGENFGAGTGSCTGFKVYFDSAGTVTLDPNNLGYFDVYGIPNS